jgi:serine/threonine-protein kinase
MGEVYLAEHTLIGRRAAIKFLLPGLSTNQEAVGRFFNEARSTASLKHPGLIEVFDFGTHSNGSAYIVMELLEGETLADRIRRDGKLQSDLAAALSRQIASALGAAHGKGIVHRDLKPENLFLMADREIPCGLRVKVLDFGIAKLAGGDTGPATGMTRTGTVMGTPAYMSPEQCRGAGQVDHRADIYSLGCIMYEMVTGRPPFVAEGFGAVIAAQITQQPASPQSLEPSVPPHMEYIILKALAKDPADRPASMAELERAIEDNAISGRYAIPTSPMPATKSGRVQSGAVSRPTLSEFASEMEEIGVRKLGKGVYAAVAVAGAVIAGVTVAIVSGGNRAAPPPPAATQPPAPPTATAPPPRPVDPAGSGVKPPALVKLSIETEPAGADVFRLADGVLVGQTPLVQEVAHSKGQAVFVVKLAGYQEKRVELDASRDNSQHVALLKLATPPRPHPMHAAPHRPETHSIRDGVIDPF